ncbi:Phosphodiesterase [Apodemus speciosus]|uniref:Phosphodiesterase n=1 Tax=Apodemus speciosus TaxID=105296 RepID=A0ABQ0FMM5_APOSI
MCCLPFAFKGGSKGPALLALRNRTDSRGQMSHDSTEGAVGSCNATVFSSSELC